MGLSTLSNVLWRERELLELLLFKLEEEQLLLSAGKAQWIGRATHEVETVLEAIGQVELLRATEVTEVARELGLPGDVSLRELIGRTPEPWSTILAEHRKKFLEITAAVTALAEANRELISHGQRAAMAALSSLTSLDEGDGAPMTYGRAGVAETAHLGPRLLDGAL